MEIILRNCNNIDSATIEVTSGKLNIKYAINGTGKSTISKAIVHSVEDREKGTSDLQKLRPFKGLENNDSNPEVSGADDVGSVRIFDEEYTNKYLFLPDELLQGSFDIFIRDSEYERGMAEIESLTRSIQEMFVANADIDELIADFNELSSSFGKPVKTGIHGSSNISKAFKAGNKIQNVPEEIKEYGEFIQSGENIKWIKWIIDGRVYLDLSENCPYCVASLKNKKEKIAKISDVYEPKTIEYLNKIVQVFNRLSKYFSENTKELVEQFISSPNGYTDEQVSYLLEIKDQIDSMNRKFQDTKGLGFRSLKNVDQIIEQLRNQKIDVAYYSHLQSDSTKEKAEIVNTAIENILEKAGMLQGKINLQKKHIQQVIEENKAEINSFLENAGYRYQVDIVEDEKKQYSIKLLHKDYQHNAVDDVRQHLSFGERNAFAIVLFMYDVLKSTPDLVVLDDPISSFDKNKKYAIVDMLFRKEKSLRGMTVLMLTHDFEPIVDMVYHHRDRFDIPIAAFLENTNGTLIEKPVSRGDIFTFLEICQKNTASSNNNITRLVYIRRKLEIVDDKGPAYNVISNLLHKRAQPILPSDGDRAMTDVEIQEGIDKIATEGVKLNYADTLAQICDDNYLRTTYSSTASNYEKLHLFRVFSEGKDVGTGSLVISKFVNEAFHIENEYIYQLNPCNYQLVPQYVIDICDRLIAGGARS